MKFLDNNETKLVEIGKLISFIVKLERIDENLRIELSNIKIWKEVILSVFHLFITIVVKRSKFKCKTERRYFFSRVGEGGAGAGPAAADSSSRQMLFHNETNQFSASSSGENKSTWFSLQTKITLIYFHPMFSECIVLWMLGGFPDLRLWYFSSVIGHKVANPFSFALVLALTLSERSFASNLSWYK